MTLVLVASLVPVKRHELLLRALASAVSIGADVRLQLVGDGPLRMHLEKLATILGIEGRVDFFGHVADREILAGVLDAADVFVMTSSTEGMPRSMIEGMARGLPVLGSDVGGIAELLESDQRIAGVDPQLWGQRIAELQSDVETMNEYSRRSHRVANAFEQQILTARRQRILSELAATVRNETR